MLILYYKSLLKIVKFTSLISIIVGFLFLQSCNKDKKKTDINIADIQVNNPIIRLDSVLFSKKTDAEVLAFLVSNRTIAEAYFDTPQTGFAELAKKLNSFVQNADLQQFYQKSINNTEGIKIDSLQTELNLAFRHIKYYYPKFSPPKIYTFFTGFAGKDILVSDSVIVIGLDYFVGKNAQFRPQVYDYQLAKYQKEYIVPSVLNQLAIKYARVDPADKSLLADMIFYGKCYQFSKTMQPNSPDSLIIGYTQNQLEETEISQEIVWGHFIDQKLLYETSPFKKVKYLDERPNTVEISPDCPGMIGRWLGWKIVKKFVENKPEQTFQILMQNEKAQSIFELSKYKGKADIE
jgi:hypothetical protein